MTSKQGPNWHFHIIFFKKVFKLILFIFPEKHESEPEEQKTVWRNVRNCNWTFSYNNSKNEFRPFWPRYRRYVSILRTPSFCCRHPERRQNDVWSFASCPCGKSTWSCLLNILRSWHTFRFFHHFLESCHFDLFVFYLFLLGWNSREKRFSLTLLITAWLRLTWSNGFTLIIFLILILKNI